MSCPTPSRPARIAFIVRDGRALDYFRNVMAALPTADIEVLTAGSGRRILSGSRRRSEPFAVPERSIRDALRSGARYRVVVSTSVTSAPLRFLPRSERRRMRGETSASGPGHRSSTAPLRRLLQLLRQCHATVTGPFMRRTRIDRLLIALTGRPWTGSGTVRQGSRTVPAEALLAPIRVLFPHGVDAKSKPPPAEPALSVWSVALCHGPIDSADRRERTAAPTIEIGYPRYDHLEVRPSTPPYSPLATKTAQQRPRVLWLPTADVARPPGVPHSTILWSPYVRALLDDADVIVRPHPRDLTREASLSAVLKRQGFEVDQELSRDLGRSLIEADLVLCDYGGTVFSAVYLDRPLILLERANAGFDAPLIHTLRKGLVRIQLETLVEAGSTAKEALRGLLDDEEVWVRQVEVRRRVRETLFGPSPQGGAARTARFLQGLADGSPPGIAAERADLELIPHKTLGTTGD